MRGARRQTPIKKDLSILQWNARSVNNKTSGLKLLIYTKKNRHCSNTRNMVQQRKQNPKLHSIRTHPQGQNRQKSRRSNAANENGSPIRREKTNSI